MACIDEYFRDMTIAEGEVLSSGLTRSMTATLVPSPALHLPHGTGDGFPPCFDFEGLA